MERVQKVERDFKKVVNSLFSNQPYAQYKEHFNCYGLFKPSLDSGPDEPTKKIFKDTAVGATFNSLGLPRYMLFEDNKKLRDITSNDTKEVYHKMTAVIKCRQ